MATEPRIAESRIASVNPATGEVLREFDCASPAEVRAAVARARAAQPAWQALGVAGRSDVLRRFQQVLHKRKSDVARLITCEVGKPIGEALLSEVVVALDAARFCIENASEVLRTESLHYANPVLKSKSGRIVQESWGVVGIVSPWNYPFGIPASEILAALATGNAVVLKPSEFTPLCAIELAGLLALAGVPKGIVEVVVGDGSTGAALLSSDIDKLIFTGSVATGKRVAQA